MVRVPAEGLQSPKGHQIPPKLDESFTFSFTHSLTLVCILTTTGSKDSKLQIMTCI